MEKETNYIEIKLSDLWKVFRRCWWILLAVAVLFSGATYFFMKRTLKDQYQSTATVYVLRTDGRSQLNYQDAMFASSIIGDVDKLILSEDNVIKPAIKKLARNADYSESELRTRISQILQKVSVKTAGTDSRLVYITVTSNTPEGAANIANAVASAATEYLNDMFGQEVLNITDAAKQPKSISNPISMLKVGAVGVAVAVLIYLVWLVLYLVDDKIDSEDEVEKRLGLTVLGSIPYMGAGYRGKKRYGSYYGYYGYGYGYRQLNADTSADGKKEGGQKK